MLMLARFRDKWGDCLPRPLLLRLASDQTAWRCRRCLSQAPRGDAPRQGARDRRASVAPCQESRSARGACRSLRLHGHERMEGVGVKARLLTHVPPDRQLHRERLPRVLPSPPDATLRRPSRGGAGTTRWRNRSGSRSNASASRAGSSPPVPTLAGPSSGGSTGTTRQDCTPASRGSHQSSGKSSIAKRHNHPSGRRGDAQTIVGPTLGARRLLRRPVGFAPRRPKWVSPRQLGSGRGRFVT
jgi:hypothetical protein